MGWPTKGTGGNYNSHTGFGYFLGAYKHKILMSHIYNRRCQICEVAKGRFTPPNKHECIQFFSSDAFSKSMESCCIILLLTKCVEDQLFVMETIVSDDNNIMCSHLRHKKFMK